MNYATNENLNRRDFLRRVGLGTASLVILGSTSAANQPTGKIPKDKPNIVLFLADDQSINDVGCYGNNVIRTPHTDRLAKEGLKFNLAFTPTAMCSPSRSALYTGLYPHRNGCHPNHSRIKSRIKTLPYYLISLGYRVGLAGKTHIKPKDQFPFEYMGLKPKQIENFMTLESDEPFCLIVASHEPHGPHKKGGYKPEQVLVPPNKVDTQQTRQQLANYYTDIDLLDAELGRVLNLLKKHNLEQNTLFVYTSDHGYDIFAKWSCYDAGLHVPFIVRWPAKIKHETTTDAMISFVDVLPTFIEAAGGKPAEDIDGRSFLSVLLGRKKKHHDVVFGTHTTRGIISGRAYPIRSLRTKTHKYIRNLNPDGMFQCVTTHGHDYKEIGHSMWGSWKQKAKTDSFAAKRVKMFQYRPAEELYDIIKDPYELNNIADDPTNKKLLASLRKKLDAWMKQQGDRGMQAEIAVNLHKSRNVKKPKKKPQKN
ncbi:MAG: sulfatase-like hydrolase/transferase [Phycisphaerae bacterium]|nr:sulfatase [Phycisphaerae bacterium]NIP53205.1 sulfatase [Phycisphaerae bacterium]NIS52240.1 sulfatase [Phycisphaerae bacterium]NIU09766.1 sulfatase [Phycisphaerae bacterium]NIU59186.1 sulfatase-like hydrolase/transferase [Phycisphaerae bacterium]